MVIFLSPVPGPATQGQGILRNLMKFGKKLRLATGPHVAQKKKHPFCPGRHSTRSQCVGKVTTEIKATSLGETVAYLTCPHHVSKTVCA